MDMANPPPVLILTCGHGTSIDVSARRVLMDRAQDEISPTERSRDHDPQQRCTWYTRVVNGVARRAVLEVSPNSKEQFAEQESGEAGWFPFEAFLSERETTRRLREHGVRTPGWDDWIDVDVLLVLADTSRSEDSELLTRLQQALGERVAQFAGIDVGLLRAENRERMRSINTHMRKGCCLVGEVARWLRVHRRLSEDTLSESPSL